MKTNFILYFISGLFLTTMFISCNSELPVEKKSQPDNEELTIGQDIIAQCVAKSIASQLGNKALKSFLQEEALKKVDGDNDILFLKALNTPVNRSTRGVEKDFSFKEIFKKGFEKTLSTRATTHDINLSFDQLIEIVQENYPTLQISIPETDACSLDKIDLTTSSPIVIFLPVEYNDQVPTMLIGYDEYGNEHILSSEEVPNFPVIVIGRSERITAIPIDEYNNLVMTRSTETAVFTVVYHDDYYVYVTYAGGQIQFTISYYNDNPELFTNYQYIAPPASTPPPPPSIDSIDLVAPTPDYPMSRDMNDRYDYITKAKFRDQNALEACEGWPNGRPEVNVNVLSMNAAVVKQIVWDGDDNVGWWNGATKTLNSQIVNWNKSALGQYLLYHWSEIDGGDMVQRSFTMTLPAGGGTVVVGVEAGEDDEQIGMSLVNYDDLIPTGGREYDPSGKGSFLFWLDLLQD